MMKPTLVSKVLDEMFLQRFGGSPSFSHNYTLPHLKRRLFMKLCFEATVKCSFSDYGCPFTGIGVEVSSHEIVCKFSLKRCLLYFVNGTCSWVGRGPDVKEHYESAHFDDPLMTDSTSPSSPKESCDVKYSPGQSMEELIVAELECPVCYVCMTPPISQCYNGHSVCTECTHRIECCPICRGRKCMERNAALDVLYLMVKVPCRNEAYGCGVRAKGILVQQHKKTCAFVPTPCPLRKNKECRWKGLMAQIPNHCKKEHPDNFFDVPEYTWDLRGFVSHMSCYNVFHVHGMLFSCYWYKRENNILFCIAHMEKEPFLERFKYETKFYVALSEFASNVGDCQYIENSVFEYIICNDAEELFKRVHSNINYDLRFVLRIIDRNVEDVQ